MLLKAAEAARFLAISPRTLWGLTKDGQIPAVRVGKRGVRYDPADLKAWADSQKTRGAGGHAPAGEAAHKDKAPAKPGPTSLAEELQRTTCERFIGGPDCEPAGPERPPDEPKDGYVNLGW